VTYVVAYIGIGWASLFLIFLVYRTFWPDGTECYERALDVVDGPCEKLKRRLINVLVVPALAAAFFVVTWPLILFGRFEDLISWLPRTQTRSRSTARAPSSIWSEIADEYARRELERISRR
jgi:hypothetical protein